LKSHTGQIEEKALVVGVVFPGIGRIQEEESLNELVALAETAGARVVGKIMQTRNAAHAATFIGKGKLGQLARKASESEAGMIIFNADLTPAQARNLEGELKRKILDRSGLILDIFARHARTRESQIQVELAQLQYYLPRLTRLWTHLSRQEAGIGTRGPGETQLESDRRAIRKRIGHLQSELEKIERQRSIRRKHRRNVPKAALVGYTNVGKSSLLNALADSRVFVENRLFATLDATIRSMELEETGRVLLIDTVGFIRKLPHHLVASFRSTLEESREADILLHVVDVSHAGFEEQMATVQSVLKDLDLDRKPVITVFNKVDRVASGEDLALYKQRYPDVVFTSALKGMGLNALKSAVVDLLHQGESPGVVAVPHNASRAVAAVYDLARVVRREHADGQTILHFFATAVQRKKIDALVDRVMHEHTDH